jgi:predicted kinase
VLPVHQNLPVVLPVDQNLPVDDVRALHKQLAEHLAGGRSVLVDAANTDKNDRRALLDLASRYLASTLAVVCSPSEGETDMIAALPAEGWQAVVVAR